MIIWTWTFSTIFILTLVCFIKHWMIWLLLPPMTHVTCCTIFTASQIIIYHMLSLPIYTWYWLIWIYRWIPSIILPIMRIYTLIFFMFSQVKDTKLCFVIKHVKVLILKIVMNQFGLDLFLTMSICTELFIWTFRDRIWPMCTKTFTIILWMILFLDWWMSLCTLVTRWTFLPLFYVWTHISWIEISRSTTILFIMIIDAQLMIMFDSDIAWRDFEYIKIQLLLFNI